MSVGVSAPWVGSPEYYVCNFAGQAAHAEEPRALITFQRHLAVASLLLKVENPGLGNSLQIYEEALAEHAPDIDNLLDTQHWPATLRQVITNIGPRPITPNPRDLLMKLSLGDYEYVDLSLIRHPAYQSRQLRDNLSPVKIIWVD